MSFKALLHLQDECLGVIVEFVPVAVWTFDEHCV